MRRQLLASCLLLAAALPASADTVLQKARAMSKDGPLYTFDMDVRDGADQFRMTVDPSQPKGQRVTDMTPALASLKGDAAKKAERLQARTEGDIWCSGFTENIPADAKRTSETAKTATFSFTPLPGKDDGQMGDAFKHLKGTAIIDKATGGILSYEMSSPKAFKPAAVAKVDRFSLKATCKAAPDGRTHVETFALDLKGSALMKPFEQSETRRVSNLTAIAQSGFGTP
ncbi:MAG: hypothetical protein RLO80_06865 [Hyphomonas sp.]